MGQEIKSAPNPVGSLMQSGFASQEATRYRTNLDNNFAGHQRLAGAFAPQEGGPLYAFDPADVNTGSNLIDWTACPLLDDQPIKFENSVAVADLPDPLIVGTTYYVFNKLTNSFQVATSLASGTTALGLTDTGSGKHILVPQPIMRVWVGPGFLFDGATRTEVAGQFTGENESGTGLIVAPSTNPRIDLVYIDAATGAVGVVTGAEAASPSEPALPSGKLPVALVTLQTSTTAISNQEITDVRALGVTDPGAIIEQGAGAVLKPKVIEIGDWDMDATDSINVAHGISGAPDTILSATAAIRSDAGFGNNTIDLSGTLEATPAAPQGAVSWGTTNINLRRLLSGVFDSTSYDATGYNRGFITVWYVG